MKRPVGVTILAIVQFVGAAGNVVWLALVLHKERHISRPPWELSDPIRDIPVMLLVLAIAGIPVLIGLGLWRLRNWARVITMIFGVIGLLACMGAMVSIGHVAGGEGRGTRLLMLSPFLLLAIWFFWTIWYMLDDNTERAFGVGKASS